MGFILIFGTTLDNQQKYDFYKQGGGRGGGLG